MLRIFLIVLTMCPPPDQPFDPRKIPARERVAYVNKLADRLSGENGASDLELAATCYTHVEDLREWDAPEAQRAACRQVYYNEAALAMADGWKGSNRRIIDEWLVANTKCLRTLKQALTFDRCYQAYRSAGGRAHSALTEMHSIRTRLAGLLAMIAIKEYERKKGKLPRNLKQLPRSFNAAAAVDPFSGEPLVYRRAVEGKDFILYSVGADQKDDGGRHVADWLKEGDHVFWPPQTPEVRRTE